MADAVPPELARLVAASDRDEREAAWIAFLSVHNPILLRVVSSLHGSHDEEMDAYACILEKLRSDDYRRLADYRVDVRSSFSTWLAVVARRIGLDLLRHRYGRIELSDELALERRATRRRLVELVSSEPDMAELPQSSSPDPERALEQQELLASLDKAVAQLNPNEQLLVGLRFYDGLSAAEIAKIVSAPTAFHVYRRLNLILKKLRRLLVRRGVERSDG